jgi:hypothetical protein
MPALYLLICSFNTEILYNICVPAAFVTDVETGTSYPSPENIIYTVNYNIPPVCGNVSQLYNFRFQVYVIVIFINAFVFIFLTDDVYKNFENA